MTYCIVKCCIRSQSLLIWAVQSFTMQRNSRLNISRRNERAVHREITSNEIIYLLRSSQVWKSQCKSTCPSIIILEHRTHSWLALVIAVDMLFVWACNSIRGYDWILNIKCWCARWMECDWDGPDILPYHLQPFIEFRIHYLATLDCPIWRRCLQRAANRRRWNQCEINACITSNGTNLVLRFSMPQR